MRKSVYIGLGIILSGSAGTALIANSRSSNSMEWQDSRVQIKAEELPDAIKKTLAEDKYKAWEVQSAYRVNTTFEYYEVTLRKEAETKMFKFDKNGKPIDEIK